MTTTRQINKYSIEEPPLYRIPIDNHISIGVAIIIDEMLPLDRDMIVDEGAFVAFVLDNVGDFIGCKEKKIRLTESECPFMNWPAIWGLQVHRRYRWKFRDISVFVSPVFTVKPSNVCARLLETEQTGRVMWVDEITDAKQSDIDPWLEKWKITGEAITHD